VEQSIQLRFLVGSLEFEHLDALESQLVKLRRVALSQLRNNLAFSIHQTCYRRRIMRLSNVNEVPPIRSNIHRMMKSPDGKPLVVFSIETDAVKLELDRIVPAAGGVVELPRILIHVHDIAHVKFVIRERCHFFSTQVVKVKVSPTGAL